MRCGNKPWPYEEKSYKNSKQGRQELLFHGIYSEAKGNGSKQITKAECLRNENMRNLDGGEGTFQERVEEEI